MKFSRYQIAVVAMLAFLQFTVVLDFMMLPPLGALLMHDLAVVPGGLRRGTGALISPRFGKLVNTRSRLLQPKRRGWSVT